MYQLFDIGEKPREISSQLYAEYKANKRIIDYGSFIYNDDSNKMEWWDLNTQSWKQSPKII